MAFIMGSIPYFECLVRREYTLGRESGHGEFVPAIAHAVRSVRGHSLWVQCMLLEPYGGCAFLVPLEAVVCKPCPPPPDLTHVQPWDCFSSEFGVAALDFVRHGAVEVLPDRVPGQYHCTLDFAGSDLAEHPEQHKSLHIVRMENGLVGAFPNNRLLWHDRAFWQTVTEVPRFKSLPGSYRAEGNQALFPVVVPPAPPAAPPRGADAAPAPKPVKVEKPRAKGRRRRG